MKNTRRNRTAAESATLNATLTVGILDNKTVEEIAQIARIPTTYCYTLLRRRLGVNKFLLLPNEEKEVKARRKQRLRKWRKLAA